MPIKTTSKAIKNLAPTTFNRNLWLLMGMLVLIAVGFATYVWLEERVNRANELRIQSSMLTDELRQSSEDLTKMVRIYVATGNPLYKKYYQDILDIRNGKKPRPAQYQQIYRDFVLAGDVPPDASSHQLISLLDLMRQADFSEQEIQKLTTAKTNSDTLTKIEFEAMRLSEAAVVAENVAEHNKATLMLHDEVYLQAKSSIMKPINDVISMMDMHTIAAVNSAEMAIIYLRALIIVFAIGLTFILIRTYSSLKNQLGGTPQEVYSLISNIGTDGLSTAIHATADNEDSVLGWLAKKQASLIELERERNINESDLRIAAAAFETQDGIVVTDAHSVVLRANSAFSKIIGYTVEEVVGRDMNFIQSDRQDAHFYTVMWESILSNGSWQGEIWNRIKSGETRLHWLTISTVKNEDNVVTHYVGTYSDITERKQAEVELTKSIYRQRATVDASPVPLALNDEQGNITYLNNAFIRQIGYTLEDIPTIADWWPYAYPDPQYRQWVADKWQKSLEEAKRTSQPFVPIELKIQCKDGLERYFMVSASAIEGGYTGEHVVAFYDITERKQADEALRESEFRWKFAIEGSGDGLWDWNVPESSVFFSTRWKTMLGFAGDEIGSSLDEWSKRIHPDDMAKVMADVQAHLDGTTPHYVNEHRVSCKDGSWKWILDRGVVVERDAAGKALRVIGTHTDITSRKQAALALLAALQDKDALLKEVHHRVKNNLQVITSLLRLEAGRCVVADTKEVLGYMRGRIRTMAQLHESLYRSGTFASVDLGVYLSQVATQAFKAQELNCDSVRLTLNLGSVQAGMDQATAAGLLLNELVSNCLKHGFPEGQTGEVSVELQPANDQDKPADGRWSLRVSDTGAGLSPDFEDKRKASLGLQLVTDMNHQLDGILVIDSVPGAGARFSVEFTVQAPAVLVIPP